MFLTKFNSILNDQGSVNEELEATILNIIYDLKLSNIELNIDIFKCNDNPSNYFKLLNIFTPHFKELVVSYNYTFEMHVEFLMYMYFKIENIIETERQKRLNKMRQEEADRIASQLKNNSLSNNQSNIYNLVSNSITSSVVVNNGIKNLTAGASSITSDVFINKNVTNASMFVAAMKIDYE